MKVSIPKVAAFSAGWALVVLLASTLPRVDASVYLTYSLKAYGSDIPSTIFNLWKYVYPATQVSRSVTIKIQYDVPSVANVTTASSTTNVQANVVTQGTYDFASLDTAISDTDYAASSSSLRPVPVLVGGISVVFNLPTSYNITKLKLTRANVAAIFTGAVTNWGDASISANNPTLAGANLAIKVLTRGDYHSSTYTLTDAIRSFSPGTFGGGPNAAASAWASSTALVPFASPYGSANMMLGVLRTPGSIGYVDYQTTLLFNPTLSSMAYIQNAALNFTVPSTETLMATAAAFDAQFTALKESKNFFLSIVNGPGASVYPIATLSYVLLRVGYPSDCSQNYEVVRFAYWMLTSPDAQSQSTSVGYTVLPSPQSSVGLSLLQEFRCSNGLKIYSKILADIINESNDSTGQLFLVAIAVTGAVVFLAIIGIFVYWTRAKNNSVLTVTMGQNQRFSMATHDKHATDPVQASLMESQSRVQGVAVYTLIHVLVLVLDWSALRTLPDGLNLNTDYANILAVGTAYIVFAMAVQLTTVGVAHAYPLMRTKRAKGGAITAGDLTMTGFEALWDTLKIVSVAFLELPMTIVSIKALRSNTSISALLILAFTANAAGAGWKLTFLTDAMTNLNKYWRMRTIYNNKKSHLATANAAIKESSAMEEAAGIRIVRG